MHPPPPAPPEVVRRLAPAGEYFLIQYVSSRTPSGVIGFPPGTRVTKQEERGDVWLVSDGRYEIEVRPAQLTNDLDVAEWVVRSDDAAQIALAEFQQRERDEWQRAQLANASRQAAGMSAADASARNSVGDRDTRLNDAAAPVSNGRSVAGAAWVYPALTVVERRTAGPAADLRLRVPNRPQFRANSAGSSGGASSSNSPTVAPAAGTTPRATPIPSPKP